MTQTRGNDRELMERAGELRAQGKSWQEVAEIIGHEFTDPQGNPWKGDTLKGNFHRWNKDKKPEPVVMSDLSEASDLSAKPESEPLPVEDPTPSDTSEGTDTIAEPTLSDSSDASDIPQEVDSDMSVISDKTPMPEAWASQIRQIVQKELQAMQPEPQFTKEDIVQIIQKELTSMETTVQTGQTVQTEQVPTMEPAPAPGERITGTKGKPINPGKRVKVAGTVDEVLERRIREWCRENRTTLSYALDAALWHFFGKPKLSFEMSEASEATPNTEE